MNRVQSMFGRHFSTPAGQAVETATSQVGHDPTQEDSVVHFTEVCRVVNTYVDGPKDAIRAFRKRLMGNKNLTQVSVSVALLEFCVKNLDFNFHVLVASRDFAGEVLVRLLNPKTQPLPVIEKRVLGIIKMLAEAYPNTVIMSDICILYHDLLTKGHEFPRVKALKVAPLHRRSSSQSSHSQQQRAAASSSTPPQAAPRSQIIPPTQPVHLNREQLGKLRRDISVVEGNVKVFSEMLTEIDPSGGDSYDLQLMGELNRTCRAMQQRIVELIGQVLNEEMTVELLRINDDLNNVFLRYERFERYRTKQPANNESPPNPTPTRQHEPPPSYSDTEHQKPQQPAVSNDLIDLGFDPEPTPPATASSSAAPGTSSSINDDFSMLSLNTPVVAPSQPPSHLNGNDLSEQLAAFAGGDRQQQEAEVKEIEQWLANDQQFGSSSNPPQVPTDNFMQDDFSAFLNERAAAATSSNPTAAQTSSTTSSSQNPPTLL